MAIFRDLLGIEVVVSIGNKPLMEYNDEGPEVAEGDVGSYQAARTVSKFIESITDQEFTINLSVQPPYKMEADTGSLNFRVYVDGTLVRSPLLRKELYKESPGGWFRCVDGIRGKDDDGNNIIHSFRFADIKTTIDEEGDYNINRDAQLLAAVGELKIMIYRKSDAVESKKGVRGSLEKDYNTAVHEKSMKGQAKSHGTTLGKISQGEESSKYTTRMIDGADHPIAIFKFKYRSREALRSLLVIGRTPTPEPARVRSAAPTPGPGFDLDSLNSAQKQKLQQFLSGLFASKAENEHALEASPAPSDVLHSRTASPGVNIKPEAPSVYDRNIKSENHAGANSYSGVGQAAPRALGGLLLTPERNVNLEARPRSFGTLGSPVGLKREREEGASGARKRVKKEPPGFVDLTLDD